MRYHDLRTLGLLVATNSASLVVLAGCTGGKEASVMPISGRVLIDGQPLKFGTVTFQPSQGQPARGDIASDGKFLLSTYRPGDGAAVGRHKVKITCYASQDPSVKPVAGGPQESLGESLIPERYTRFDSSGLEVAILSGGNKPFEFELESEPPATESDEEPGDATSETESAPEDTEKNTAEVGDNLESTDQPPAETEPATE